MSKVHIFTSIENDCDNNGKHVYDGLAVFKEERFVYVDNDTRTIIDVGEHKMITRETDETKMILEFYSEKAVCELKKTGQKLNMNINVSSVYQSENEIEIVYKLEEQNFKFKLKYEVVK